MAEKAKSDIGKEQLYMIPLRAGFIKSTSWKRTNRAVTIIKDYLFKHAHAFDVKVSPKVNQALWQGGKNPPAKIKLKAVITDDKGTVSAMLPEEKWAPPKEKRGIKDKLLGKGKKEDLTGEERAEMEEFKKTEKAGEAPEKPAEEGKAGEKTAEKESKEEELTKEEKKIIEEAEKEVAKEKK